MANTAVGALASAGSTVDSADLDPIANVAASSSAAISSSDPPARRRLLGEPLTAEDALVALTAAGALVSTAQQLAIASKVRCRAWVGWDV